MSDDRKTKPEVPESKRSGNITVFACGGGCPKGGEHQWDGPEETWEGPEGGGGGSATCSKCGIAAIDYDMMNAP